jgi:hypothetical protein
VGGDPATRQVNNDRAARLLSEPDADDDGHNKDDSPKRWSALDLEPAEQPRWLADSRLPRAATCLLLGDEGIGKSLLWVLVVAHITTGAPFPAVTTQGFRAVLGGLPRHRAGPRREPPSTCKYRRSTRI